jgi:hypothetical protein
MRVPESQRAAYEKPGTVIVFSKFMVVDLPLSHEPKVQSHLPLVGLQHLKFSSRHIRNLNVLSAPQFNLIAIAFIQHKWKILRPPNRIATQSEASEYRGSFSP